jgi:hypothetical protein
MKPIDFPEVTVTWAKDQPPYLPLPAYTDDEQTITCWRLTFWERLRIALSGKLWLMQLNFGRPLQPQKPMVDSPFLTDDEQAAQAAAQIFEKANG